MRSAQYDHNLTPISERVVTLSPDGDESIPASGDILAFWKHSASGLRIMLSSEFGVDDNDRGAVGGAPGCCGPGKYIFNGIDCMFQLFSLTPSA